MRNECCQPKKESAGRKGRKYHRVPIIWSKAHPSVFQLLGKVIILCSTCCLQTPRIQMCTKYMCMTEATLCESECATGTNVWDSVDIFYY